MPDETTDGQVPSGADQVSTDQQQTTEANQELDGAFDPERALRTIRQLRAEAKQAKASLKEYESLKQERLSEGERLQQRADNLERDLRTAQQQHQDRELDWALERAAAKQNCADPEAARLLLRQSDLLEVDDEGRPKNIDQALKLLLKERPWLAAAPSGPPPSVGNPPTRQAQTGQRTYTRADLMDHSLYVKNRDDILAAYRENRISDS